MSDLVVKFQEGLSQDLQTLNECASKEDVQAIRVNVHKISGAAQLFGFSELSELSSALEQLIKSGATEMSEIQSQYNKLIKEIEKNSTSLSN
jgi:HPt (histidine-containing phosphotransfer) domain-containing protein